MKGLKIWLHADNETKVDLLNNEAIAKTIVSTIKDSKEQPISIGIHGDWGAGKSSILEMVRKWSEAFFSVRKKYSCIDLADLETSGI